jgi:hypothetical protein
MSDFDSSQYPVIYRAISKKGALELPHLAFFRRAGEEGLSVLLAVNCGLATCEANRCFGFNTCYGEYELSTERVQKLGLTIRLDSPDSPDYSENHAEIIGIPIDELVTRLEAETWASKLVDTEPVLRRADPVFKIAKTIGIVLKSEKAPTG